MASSNVAQSPEPAVSRRSFLRRAGGAAAVIGGTGLVGLGPLLGSRTHAAEMVGRGQHPLTKAHDASVPVRWIETLYDANMRENITPTAAARTYAYASVALYQAVLGGMPGRLSLAGQLTDLSAPPRADPGKRYDWPTAANAAMAVAATRLFASGGPQTLAEIGARRAEIDAERSARVAADVVARSRTHGDGVGAAIMDWADQDGLTAIRALPTYVPPVGPDKWRSTPPNFGTAIEPYWGQMRPFALPSAGSCFPRPHIAYDETPASAFHAQAMRVVEVSQLVRDDPDLQFIAMFWRDNPLTSGLPSGHWFIIANQLTDQLALRLDDAAEMYVRLGVALADAFISCWHAKYVMNLLRPISYIHALIDPTWVSHVNTPQFPEYTSGHSVASQAAAVVLTDFFGTVAFSDTHRLTVPPSAGTRHFSSFQAAATEAATSRLYGGIHYPMGIEVGLEQGEKVGRLILERVRTRAD